MSEDDRTEELELEGGATEISSPSAIRRASSEMSIPGVDTSGIQSTPPSATYAATATSPADALRIEEVDRTRTFLRIAMILLVTVTGALPVLGGNHILELAIFTCNLTSAVACGWLYFLIRDPARYTYGKVAFVAMTCVVTAYVGVFYWGVFSAAPALIVMGIYFFSRSQNHRTAVAVYVVCAAAQGGFSALILTGVVDDPGLFPVGDGALIDQVITQALVQMIYLFTYIIARSTRRSTLEAIEQLQDAQRRISQREALFQEVKQELDEALRQVGAGRYTDKQLGRYKLGTVLGRGAMGEVYAASHVVTGDEAAVKVLHPNVLENPQHVERFLREAHAAGAMDSPHVVKVLDASDALDPLPYLAMERLRGFDLAHHLRKQRRLSVRQLVKLLREVGSVLDLARQARVVHRDLKPQNLLLAEQPDGDPIWKVLDFGVSKLGETSGTLTQGNVIGTPVYMAPEQARGEHTDYRADLYGLGAVAYRCLTGRPPFSGRDVPAILFSVVYEMPPQPTEFAELHPDVDAALAIAIAKDPADRFESGVELATAVELAAQGRLDNAARAAARRLQARQPWGMKR